MAALLSGTVGTRAWAQDAAAAEALFQQGRAAVEQGDYVTACAKFHESNRLDPALGTVLNIADCEEHQGKLATAWTYFEEVAQRAGPGDDRAALAKERAQRLLPRLPRLTVRLSTASDAVRVSRDGVELGRASWGVALPVDPGRHRLVVSVPGHQASSVELELAEGEQREVRLEPGPRLARAKTPAPQAEPSTRSTWGWVAGGVGVAGLAVGGVAGALVLGKKSIADDHCPASRCDATGYDAVEAGRTLAVISTTGFVVGALGVVSGAYLLLSGESPPSAAARRLGPPRAAAPRWAAPRLGVVGGATPLGGSVMVFGKF